MKETYTIKINPSKESAETRSKRIQSCGSSLVTKIVPDKKMYSRKTKHKQELLT